MASNDTTKLNSELARLSANGFTGPKHPFRAMQSYGDAVEASRFYHDNPGKFARAITSSDSPEVRMIKEENDALSRAMGDKRRASHGGMHRTGADRAQAQSQRWSSTQHQSVVGGGGSSIGGDVLNAIPRFYDPLEYWDLSGLPWNVADEGHRHKLHKWLRLYYATHYLVPILVDIFTRFPLVGMELQHEDKALCDVYEEMFLNQLHYEDFLVSLGREVWLVGEAFPLGSFVPELGIWEHEGLINPEDVVIDNFPLLDSQQLKIVPPDYLRRIAQTKTPAREWFMLQQNYGDLIPYLLKGEHIPMSPVILQQVANKMNDWDDHGTPILLRGLRTLLHEEKLMASQDAIAERLYSPFILAKLGIMDMGDNLPPWLPTPEELESVRDDIDIAMASDFRVMVHHFGLELSSVFGREQMPRLGDDFDRIERRLMQVFGVNPSLLSAGSNSQPYASSALQAEFMNQILRTFQKQLKEHFKSRAMVVAEAQGHYDYERKGQTRIKIYETVMEPDEEGELRPVRKPKYTCPTLNFACLAYGSRVSTESGPVATESLQVGDRVIAWDLPSDSAIVSRVTHSYDNGVKDVYQIKTLLGRQIRATAEHPFLTPQGWSEADKLEVGTELRIGTEVPGFEAPSITERDARFLGLIVGDGCVSCCGDGAVPALANTDDEVLRWTENYIRGFGCSLTPQADGVTHYLSQIDQRVNPNPIKEFLVKHNLADHNVWTKRIPREVWRGGPGIWAAFLSGYMDADGTIKTDVRVAWDSRNKPLLQDCQDLLSFLGVRASLYTLDLSAWPDPRGICHEGPSYRLVVQSKEGLATCQRWLEPLILRKQRIYTKVRAVDERRSLSPEQAQEIKTIVANRPNRLAKPTYREIGHQFGVSASTVWRARQGEYDELIDSWVSPRWDTVKEIELIHDVPTWSLGIEVDHTHITEGLVTHNTFDLRDEATERQFLQALRLQGVPIPDDKLMIGVTWKDENYVEEYNQDIKYKTIMQQQAKMDTYIALVIKGLPVPQDLKAEVESVLGGGTGPAPPPDAGAGGAPPPDAGGGPPPGGGGSAPDAGGMMMPPPPPDAGPGGPGSAPPGGGPPPTAPNEASRGTVPEASNERRPGLRYNTSVNSVDELAEWTREWPEHLRKRAVEIWANPDSVPFEKTAESPATVTSSETDDPETWTLRSGQKLVEENGEHIIVEGSNRLSMPVKSEKRYSLIDPLAPPLIEEKNEHQSAESESKPA